jgi:hypothetical protein
MPPRPRRLGRGAAAVNVVALALPMEGMSFTTKPKMRQ